MNTLRPGSQFRAAWQVADPNDSTTYFPQVVIRASVSNTIIGTFDLVSNGNGRYSYLWSVPGDSSGLGFQVDMTINVYTDSGHSIFSPNYQVENRIYRVKEELQNFGGGGGFDWEGMKSLIQKIVTEVVDNKIKNLPAPQVHIEKAEMPTMEGLAKTSDLDKLNSKIESVKSDVLAEFKPIKDGFKELDSNMGEFIETLHEAIIDVGDDIDTFKQETNDSINKINDNISVIGDSQSKLAEDTLKTVDDTMKNVFSSVDSVTYRKGMEMPENKSQVSEKDYDAMATRIMQ